MKQTKCGYYVVEICRKSKFEHTLDADGNENLGDAVNLKDSHYVIRLNTSVH